MERDEHIPKEAYSGSQTAALLEQRQNLTDALADAPYDIILYLRRAAVYADLMYPDLAASDAYRALLLTDEISDESFEYHEQTFEAMSVYLGRGSLPDVFQSASLAGVVAPAAHTAKRDDDDAASVTSDSSSLSAGDLAACQELAAAAATCCYQILSRNLLLCGCLRSAYDFCERGLAAAPNDKQLKETKIYIDAAARKRLRKRCQGGDDSDQATFDYSAADLPDRGAVRRELYPWNTFEPDRFSDESLAFLNAELSRAAPKCEVRSTELPILVELDGSAITTASTANKDDNVVPTCRQLGIFAKEPIAAGEVVLREYSLLTANNRLKESACDACGTELPELRDIGKARSASSGRDNPDGALIVAAPVSCPECYDTVFCDDFCFNKAQEKYHPAVCEKDVDAIAKDPDDARNADDALYVLLLARLLAMATHQERHPLDVDEVKYIWGDFLPSETNAAAAAAAAAAGLDSFPPASWTLPFSFEGNIATPLHILEKMDLDVFADLELYDLWVFNTLYAKFRGTASARKSRRDGRPDVAAVHPLWCLANHDCDPNVIWEWGGRMVLWARDERVCLDIGDEKGKVKRPGGIEAGQEILNHYCDVELPVQLRREWASGSLGGWCMCQRCQSEAAMEAKANAQAS